MLKYIKRVEIELQSKCNRKCSWCPNTVFKRDKSIELDEEIFLKVIRELKENNFDYKEHKGVLKYISFNRFCEPMYNIDLLKKRLSSALEIMPKADYLINTNGDYLTKEALDGLCLDKLNIMDYDCKGLTYWENRLKELGVVIINIDELNKKIVGVHKNIGRVNCEVDWPLNAMLEDRASFLDEDIYYKHEDIDIKMQWRNKKERRQVPCIEPSLYVSIDYNGNVVPCCHFRSDNPDHNEYIWGNVYEDNLVNILNSDKAEVFKKLMISGDWQRYPGNCRHCQKIRNVQFSTIPGLNDQSFKLQDHEK